MSLCKTGSEIVEHEAIELVSMNPALQLAREVAIAGISKIVGSMVWSSDNLIAPSCGH